MKTLEQNPDLINNQRTLLVCARGVRSVILADQLRSKGHDKVFALNGGARTLRALSLQAKQ